MQGHLLFFGTKLGSCCLYVVLHEQFNLRYVLCPYLQGFGDFVMKPSFGSIYAFDVDSMRAWYTPALDWRVFIYIFQLWIPCYILCTRGMSVPWLRTIVAVQIT